MDKSTEPVAVQSDLFLQYLSTGQFECARLVFLQAAKEGPASRVKQLRRLARLVALGYRPAEWAYSTSCPSIPHLAWLCARLLDEDDAAVSSVFHLTVMSLCIEAGLKVEESESGTPSDRDTALARWLLQDRERLHKLMTGPSELVCVVYKYLEEFLKKEDAESLLESVTNAIVVGGSAQNAIRLFAASSLTTAPQLLARLVAENDELAVQSSYILLSSNLQRLQDFEKIRLKLDSLCRLRGLVQPKRHVGLRVLQSMRESLDPQDWLDHLIESPYDFADAPKCLKALNLLSSNNTSDWDERLRELQESVTLSMDQSIASDFRAGDQYPFATFMQSRINRLGFYSVIAETLSGVADVTSARLAFDIQSKSLPVILAHRVPIFDSDNVRRIGENIMAGQGASGDVACQLNAVRTAVWLGLLASSREDGDRCVHVTKRFFDGLKSENTDEAIRFFLTHGLRLFIHADVALQVLIWLKEWFVGPDLPLMEECIARISACDVVLRGDLIACLDTDAFDLAVACMEKGEYKLATQLGKAIGNDAIVKEAKVGADMESGVECEDVIARADVLVSHGESVTFSLNDPRVDEALKQLAKRSPTPQDVDLFAALQSTPHAMSSLDDRTLESSANLRILAVSQQRLTSNFLSFLCEFSDAINSTPKQVLHRGLWKSLVESLMDGRSRDDAFAFCEKVSLDPRMILLSETMRHAYGRQKEYLDTIDEAERRNPLEGGISDLLLRRMFSLGDGTEGKPFDVLMGHNGSKGEINDVDKGSELMELDDSQTLNRRNHEDDNLGQMDDQNVNEFSRREHSDSDFSLTEESDIVRANRERLESVLSASNGDEDWFGIVLLSSPTHLTIKEIAEELVSGRVTQQELQQWVDLVGTPSCDQDDNVFTIVAALLGLKVDEAEQLYLHHEFDVIDTERALKVLLWVKSDARRSQYQSILKLFMENGTLPPQYKTIYARASKTFLHVS